MTQTTWLGQFWLSFMIRTDRGNVWCPCSGAAQLQVILNLSLISSCGGWCVLETQLSRAGMPCCLSSLELYLEEATKIRTDVGLRWGIFLKITCLQRQDLVRKFSHGTYNKSRPVDFYEGKGQSKSKCGISLPFFFIFFSSQITLVVHDLNYEKRISKEKKIKQCHGSVKKKKKIKNGPNYFFFCIVFLSLLRRKGGFCQEIFCNWEGIEDQRLFCYPFLQFFVEGVKDSFDTGSATLIFVYFWRWRQDCSFL